MKNLRIATLNATPAPFDPAKGIDGLPTRFKVLPWGENETFQGKIVCNSTTLSRLPQMAAERNWDAGIALDFDHSSERVSPNYNPAAPVAGYGTLEVVPNEGVYMTMSSWTTDGKTLAAGGHFKALSPTVILNAKDEVVGISSVALCRTGAVKNVVFCSSWQPDSITPPQTGEDLFNALKHLLGVPHDASPSEALAQLKTKLMADKTAEENPAPQDPTPASKADDAMKTLSSSIDKLTTLVESQVETIKALSSKLEAVEKANDERERAVILSSAAAEGKEVPEAAKALPLETLKMLCSQLPVTVPVERRTPLSSAAPQSAPAQDDISRLTGVSAGDRKKYGSM